MKIVLGLLGFLLSFNMLAQSLEDDINVIYMKAEVLMQNERYDEAIRVYNQIIRDQPDFKWALFQRAKAKYALGAYQGTRKDLLEHIDLKGINKKIIHWMGKTEYELKNYEQAQSYLDVAIEMDVYDADLYLKRAAIHLVLEDQNMACEDLSQAAQLGNQSARAKLKDYCLQWEKSRTHTESNDPGEQVEPQTSEEEGGPVIKIPDYPGRNTEPEQTDPSQSRSTEDLDSSQEFKIDESLMLVVGNGLGTRKVEFVPDVFILSENEGRVVINICVNESGQVTEAIFNQDLSTLFKTNINSLAIRKSKEMVFLPSFRNEQCGTITFLIKA